MSEPSASREYLESCLPAQLRGPGTSIARVAAGLSGAGVYRVEAGGRAFVLKLAGDAEPFAAWQRRCQTQQLAARAGLARTSFTWMASGARS